MSRRLLQTLKQAIVKHWRGEYPALLTVLFLMSGLRLLIVQIPFIDNYIATLLIVSTSLLMFIWQIVGTSRCIERHLKSTGETILYWAGYFAIVVATVLTLLHTIDLLVGPPPAITKELLRKTPLPKLSEDGTNVYLAGDINFDLNDDLLTLIKTNKQLKTVDLNSKGGLIYAARALAHSIEKNELNTHVEGECNSACTIAFMAGEQRTLGTDGKIGFHQYEFQKQHPLQVEQADDEQERDRKYFAQRGITQDFLERVYQSRHQDIWQPGRIKLFDAKVITEN